MARDSGVPPTPTIQETLNALDDNTSMLKEHFPPNPEHATLDWLERTEKLLHVQKVYVERLTNFLHPHLEELILHRLRLEEAGYKDERK